jgi:hypothetical protein
MVMMRSKGENDENGRGSQRKSTEVNEGSEHEEGWMDETPISNEWASPRNTGKTENKNTGRVDINPSEATSHQSLFA